MRLSDIVELGTEYLFLGLIVAAFVGVAVWLGYRFYKKQCEIRGKEAAKLPIGKIALYGVLVCYLIVVFGATTLSRFEYVEGSNLVRLQLFYSYKDAWNDFSATEWRNIILNVLMFVPLGFLLPLVHTGFQKAWRTYLAGFGLTVLIEVVQLVLDRGIFEADDLMNNTVGAMIGYGVYLLVRAVWNGCRGRKGIRPAKVLICQIPLVVTASVFAGIFIAYDRQELGNLESECIVRNKGVNITSELTFDTTAGMKPVYQLEVVSVADTEKQAKDFFALFGMGLDEARTDIYENTAVYYSEDGAKSLWIEYAGSAFRFTDYDLLFGDKKVEKDSTAGEQEVRAALEKLNVIVPDGAVFENLENGRYAFVVKEWMQGDKMHDGRLTCSLTTDGQISEMSQNILQFKAYKNFLIISEQEAYERLTAGEFNYPFDIDWNIEVSRVELTYEVDSKGFYQPVYKFYAMMDEEEGYITIPAIGD